MVEPPEFRAEVCHVSISLILDIFAVYSDRLSCCVGDSRVCEGDDGGHPRPEPADKAIHYGPLSTGTNTQRGDREDIDLEDTSESSKPRVEHVPEVISSEAKEEVSKEDEVEDESEDDED
ncbi:hypothetical protein RHMOL_Rhmol01G0225700 [Rhododendron molle]|uniref:Uncharacterized protein n=1 Tax=Rhododendron molle TaxID=49168 RepID=A0ACC0Q461_RHOML|nr:hypothetical protein RHMOL_Rhmol01G0225700 [Rhododendron molle]